MTVGVVLHAKYHYAPRNTDPDQTIAGGLIDLGGFANLIHGHDLSRTMTIKLVFDGVDGFGSEHLQLNSGASLGAPEYVNLPIRYLVGENTDLKDYAVVQSLGIDFTVPNTLVQRGIRGRQSVRHETSRSASSR